MRRLKPVTLALVLAACGGDDDGPATTDAPEVDAAIADAGRDAEAPEDATTDDATPDATAIDGGPTDLVGRTETRVACADQNPLRNLYWGDLHIHTTYSFDAYTFDVRNDPRDAYRFARGEQVLLPPLDEGGEGTVPARLDRPLDFAAVTDHSEFLGETHVCVTPGSAGYDTTACTAYRAGAVGFGLMGAALLNADPTRPDAFCGDDPSSCATALMGVWGEVQAAAEEAYDRTDACTFTSFVAYEHTGTPGGAMVHRNVIFRNENVPAVPISYFEAPRAFELWTQLDGACVDAGTGCDVLTIPHNSNLSNGMLFEGTYEGADTLAQQTERAATRARFEPLMEIYQHKGASECFPGFSTDEECSFESLDADICDPDTTGGCTTPIDYLRGVLAEGMAEEERLGENPFAYGVIASTDNHNAVPGNVDEDSFPGHVGIQDDTRRERLTDFPDFSPGGILGVWALENSRDALFEAMQRKETYGSSGPRIAVRLFAGWGLPTDLCGASDLAGMGYALGVPMGGTLPARPTDGTMRIALVAQRDQVPLRVAQIVKIWLDASGEPHEEVFDVAGDADAAAPVDLASCAPSPVGADALCAVWEDPSFDPAVPAVYYGRVLENETCRWSQRDCADLPARLRPDQCTDGSTPMTLGERVWTSPVWYRP